MIHIDQGGSIAKTKYFFDRLNRYHIRFDVIGLSYYPWWQGTLMDLRENLASAANTYHKDIIVVETAYHWRPARETADRLRALPGNARRPAGIPGQIDPRRAGSAGQPRAREFSGGNRRWALAAALTRAVFLTKPETPCR